MHQSKSKDIKRKRYYIMKPQNAVIKQTDLSAYPLALTLIYAVFNTTVSWRRIFGSADQ